MSQPSGFSISAINITSAATAGVWDKDDIGSDFLLLFFLIFHVFRVRCIRCITRGIKYNLEKLEHSYAVLELSHLLHIYFCSWLIFHCGFMSVFLFLQQYLLLN